MLTDFIHRDMQSVNFSMEVCMKYVSIDFMFEFILENDWFKLSKE